MPQPTSWPSRRGRDGEPEADSVPFLETRFIEVPTATNPFGTKGACEAGTVAAIATVMSVVNDALASVGAPDMDTPATPFAAWSALNRRCLEISGGTRSAC